MSKTLRLILGDQLNSNHSWFSEVDSSVVYVMMEVRTETDYAKHHIQKVVGFFSAMRSFAASLQLANHNVIYIGINDKKNLQSFEKNIENTISEHQITHFEYQYPDEYRLDKILKSFCEKLTIINAVVDSEHFYSSRHELGEFFEGKKTFLMESFYRNMRKKHAVLMENEKPLTGKWNYDEDNRKKLPKNHKPITPLVFNNNVSEILAEIQKNTISLG